MVSTSSEASQSIAICSHGSVSDALELDDPSPDSRCAGEPETDRTKNYFYKRYFDIHSIQLT